MVSLRLGIRVRVGVARGVCSRRQSRRVGEGRYRNRRNRRRSKSSRKIRIRRQPKIRGESHIGVGVCGSPVIRARCCSGLATCSVAPCGRTGAEGRVNEIAFSVCPSDELAGGGVGAVALRLDAGEVLGCRRGLAVAEGVEGAAAPGAVGGLDDAGVLFGWAC